MSSLYKSSINFLAIGAFCIISCKNDISTNSKLELSKNTQEIAHSNQDNQKYLKAEFIYLSEAAVLKGDTYIYGVVLDDKARELIEKVTPLKKEKYDMIPVEVKAKIVTNPKQEGWKQLAEITEIIAINPLNVSDKNSKN